MRTWTSRTAVVAVTILLGTSCALAGDDGPPPDPAAQAFATAWSEGDSAAMAGLTEGQGRETELAVRRFQAGLRAAGTEVEVSEVAADGDEARATLAVTHELPGLGDWSYESVLTLNRAEGEWRVVWEPTVLHPELRDGRRLELIRQQAPRGPILARAGQPLVSGSDPATRVSGVAATTVGSVAVVDPDEAAERGPGVAAGDVVGTAGLEEAYDERLRGRATGSVSLIEADGAVAEELATFEGEAGEALPTTLDLAVQRAADVAVANVAQPVALVALEAETGAVRAVANNPPGFDRAFLGEYPPGSTFKIVTAAAMLEDGVGARDRLPCPPQTRPGDARPFTNADGKDGGVVTFEEAFAESCNTTFVDEGFRLGGEVLTTTAETFGFNRSYSPGIPAVVGSFPLPETDTELAAAAIGQGRVTASPLHMATVAAAARTGTWRVPYLVEPDPSLDTELADGLAPTLTDFMRAVVEDGTGDTAQVDGVDVGGKTGTAEFGDEEPPETHAWFVGFADDLVYAVVVEAGGVGGSVAGPVARTFIENL